MGRSANRKANHDNKRGAKMKKIKVAMGISNVMIMDTTEINDSDA